MDVGSSTRPHLSPLLNLKFATPVGSIVHQDVGWNRTAHTEHSPTSEQSRSVGAQKG